MLLFAYKFERKKIPYNIQVHALGISVARINSYLMYLCFSATVMATKRSARAYGTKRSFLLFWKEKFWHMIYYEESWDTNLCSLMPIIHIFDFFKRKRYNPFVFIWKSYHNTKYRVYELHLHVFQLTNLWFE